VAVQAFLEHRLNFTAIAVVIEGVLNRVASEPVRSLTTVLDADATARRAAVEAIARLNGVASDPVAGACA
jgi:1-deoxy-D-xylulose-5-phosphate reductoisomerase